MPPTRTYTYEAMFLISQAVAADLSGAVAHINELLSRAHAEVIAMRKWDERRLAFEIKKQKRGLYILCYFKAPNTSIAHLERDCNLSEKVLRAMILRADHLSVDEMRAADGREALETEAKLRATREREEQQAAMAGAVAGDSAEAAEDGGAEDEPE
ncbi:MAG: 30S ribosomal protein S6 [Phycisphaerales bacterium]|nr:30S ribosomal protein S6 [Phycisphaerales bacterium]